MGTGMGGVGTGPSPIHNDEMGAASFESKKKAIGGQLHFKQQEGMSKTANVMSQVKAEKMGEVPKEISTGVSGKLASADLGKLGSQPEAVKVKQQTEQTGSFLTKIFQFIQKMLSYLNPMAYFNKGEAEATQKAGNVAAVQATFVKATPEQLSTAANKLNEFMMSEAFAKQFETVGIFRESPSQSQKIELFNKLMTSPESVDLSEVSDPHLIAGVMKQIYKEMNLFGKDAAKFEEVGNKLLAQPDNEEVVKSLKELVTSLPHERQKDLKNFIQVLAKASESEPVNKMGFSNLAIAAGPNLCDVMSMAIIKPRQEIAHQLIAHYKEVFEG
jgi:hypothetical protein